MDVREKLVKLVEYMDGDCPSGVSCYNCPHKDIGEGCSIQAKVDYLMNGGATVQEWISVKDRLPQDDLPFGALCEIVQVLLDDGTVTVGWCNRGLKCWYYMPIQAANFVGHDYDNTPVIAWQPLAQPPKGE